MAMATSIASLHASDMRLLMGRAKGTLKPCMMKPCMIHDHSQTCRSARGDMLETKQVRQVNIFSAHSQDEIGIDSILSSGLGGRELVVAWCPKPVTRSLMPGFLLKAKIY